MSTSEPATERIPLKLPPERVRVRTFARMVQTEKELTRLFMVVALFLVFGGTVLQGAGCWVDSQVLNGSHGELGIRAGQQGHLNTQGPLGAFRGAGTDHWENVKTLLDVLLPAETALLGTAVAFYMTK